MTTTTEDSDKLTARGAAIEERLARLGVSDRMFHERTGIDRKTLRRAISGGAQVRNSTYVAIEAAIDELEAAAHEGEPPRLVTFLLHRGDWQVTVQGPIEDADEVRAQVAALIQEINHKDG